MESGKKQHGRRHPPNFHRGGQSRPHRAGSEDTESYDHKGRRQSGRDTQDFEPSRYPHGYEYSEANAESHRGRGQSHRGGRGQSQRGGGGQSQRESGGQSRRGGGGQSQRESGGQSQRGGGGQPHRGGAHPRATYSNRQDGYTESFPQSGNPQRQQRSSEADRYQAGQGRPHSDHQQSSRQRYQQGQKNAPRGPRDSSPPPRGRGKAGPWADRDQGNANTSRAPRRAPPTLLEAEVDSMLSSLINSIDSEAMISGKSSHSIFSQRLSGFFTSHYAFTLPHFLRVQQTLLVLQTLVCTLFPGAQLRAYGSSQTGLASASSDVDVSVELPLLDEWLNKVQGRGQPGVLPWKILGVVFVLLAHRMLGRLPRSNSPTASIIAPTTAAADPKVAADAFGLLLGGKWGVDSGLTKKLAQVTANAARRQLAVDPETVETDKGAYDAATASAEANAVRSMVRFHDPLVDDTSAEKQLCNDATAAVQYNSTNSKKNSPFASTVEDSRVRAEMLSRAYVDTLQRAGWCPDGICPSRDGACTHHTAAAVAAHVKQGKEVVIASVSAPATSKLASASTSTSTSTSTSASTPDAPIDATLAHTANSAVVSTTASPSQLRCVAVRPPEAGAKISENKLRALVQKIRVPDFSTQVFSRISLALTWLRFRSLVAASSLGAHVYYVNKQATRPAPAGTDISTLREIMQAPIPAASAPILDMPAAAYDDINVFLRHITSEVLLALNTGHFPVALENREAVVFSRVPVLKLNVITQAFVTIPAFSGVENDPSITVVNAVFMHIAKTNISNRLLSHCPLYVSPAPIELDLCVNNTHAYYNSMLLRTYLHLDARLLSVARFIKAWAKGNEICDTRTGTLSAYAYTVMFVCFLQQVGIVPCLQAITVVPGKRPGISQNKETCGEDFPLYCSCGARNIYYYDKKIPCLCSQPSYTPLYHATMARAAVLQLQDCGVEVPSRIQTTQYLESSRVALTTTVAEWEARLPNRGETAKGKSRNPEKPLSEVSKRAVERLLLSEDDPHALMTTILADNYDKMWSPVNAGIFGTQDGDVADIPTTTTTITGTGTDKGDAGEVPPSSPSSPTGDGDEEEDGDDHEEEEENEEEDENTVPEDPSSGISNSGNNWQPRFPTFFRENAFSESWASESAASSSLFTDVELAHACKPLNGHDCYFYPYTNDIIRVMAWARHTAYIAPLQDPAYARDASIFLQNSGIPNPDVTVRNSHVYFCGMDVHECNEVELLSLFFLWLRAQTNTCIAQAKRRSVYTVPVLSIRVGGVVTKPRRTAFPWKVNDRHPWLLIEDPFDWSHDLSRVVKKQKVQLLDRACDEASAIARSLLFPPEDNTISRKDSYRGLLSLLCPDQFKQVLDHVIVKR